MPKEDRKSLKAKEIKVYEKLKEKAEEGIKTKFHLLKPIDQNSSTKDFKEIYGVLTRVKELKQAIAAYDMDGVFIIPMDYDGDFPKQNSSSHDLFLDANKLELDKVIKGNKNILSLRCRVSRRKH